VCNQCGEQEVCPATLTDEYDAKQSQQVNHKGTTNEQQPEDTAT
jgi:hypothetical protein